MKERFFDKIVAAAFVLMLFGAGCGQQEQAEKIPADAPKDCYPVTDVFPEGFPNHYVYPNSIIVSENKLSDTERGQNVSQNAWLGSFCAKADKEKIIAWYGEKLKSMGFEYSNLESVHYWKSDNKAVLLDLSSDMLGNYVKYSLDIRGF